MEIFVVLLLMMIVRILIPLSLLLMLGTFIQSRQTARR